MLIERLHHPKGKKFVMPFLFRQIAISPKLDRFVAAVKVRRLEAVETARDERMTRNSMEQGTRWQVRSGVERTNFSFTPSHDQHKAT